MECIAYKTEVREFRRQGTTWQMRVAVLPSGDCVQVYPMSLGFVDQKSGVVKDVAFPAGVIWRSNSELLRRTKGRTSHACAADLYVLECMGEHAVNRYGSGRNDRATEVSYIRETVKTARSYVEYALATGAYTTEDRPVFAALLRQLVTSQPAVRDPHKVTARERFRRGMRLTDSLGRNNPMAAALVTGDGIGHLLERSSDVKAISLVVDRKTLFVFEHIRRHVELYQELWDALRMTARGVKRNRLQRLLETCECRANDAERQPALLARVWLWIQIGLRDFLSAFQQINVRPFCKNAAYTRRDIRDAIRLAEEHNASGLRKQFAKIRQGICWVFALDFLHRNVLGSLRFTLERLRREMNCPQRGATKHASVKITRALAPEAFADVDKRLADFISRVKKCSDADLKKKIKNRVLIYAYAAQAAMEREEWLVAKRQLVLAAHIL